MSVKKSQIFWLYALALSLVLVLVFGFFQSTSAEDELATKPYWVFFSDKGFANESDFKTALGEARQRLSQRSLDRRRRVGISKIVDEKDIAVVSEYISILEKEYGLNIRHVSNWLNSVSVDLPVELRETITNLPFVDRIQPVKSFYRNPEAEVLIDDEVQDNPPHRDDVFDYGGSLIQNEFLNIPDLHDLGLTGRGILIGVTDAGFNNLNHQCFNDLEVLDSWDFVNDDDNVANEDDMGVGDHGTKTLSILAAFDEGRMIGPAFGATYVLAKTENTESEQEVEEDNWVAAVEWMDELGVEIVSVSLTYSDWYEYEDMDGQTAVTTIAAERAVDVGMIVVVSMGNTGRNRYPGSKMGAPADGLRTFGIGSVDRDHDYSIFSSQGPTPDGRIKPDFTTLGSSIRFASDNADDVYGAGLGTSFSAPAIAGLCALLLEADPYLSPVSMRDLLREVSSNNEQPDTLLGWGIPNGLEAYHHIQFPVESQIISMSVGWNTISHNRNSPWLEVELVMAPLVERGSLIIVKNGIGQFYAPEFDFDGIIFWKSTEGLQIKLTQDEDLEIEGSACNYTAPVLLEAGWCIVSYLPDFELSPEIAFSSLSEANALVIAKDDMGRFYLPEFDFNAIPVCQPGKGYHMLLSEGAELKYPRVRVPAENDRFFSAYNFLPEPNLRETNMSLLVRAGAGVQNGWQIRCFDASSKLIGSGVVRDGVCGISLWGGEEVANFPTVKIVDSHNDEWREADIDFVSGDREYKPNGVSVIELSLVHEKTLSQIEYSPNPFNSQLRVSFHLNRATGQLAISDIQGRAIYRQDVESASGTLTIDANGWASGKYIARFSNGNFTDEKIITLIK